MARKEFIRLMESNIMILDRLSERLKKGPLGTTGYPKNQLMVLVRLNLSGRARLKDIAHREMIPAPNLCATFRKLESDGLVSRVVDEHDRRNTWYSCTEAGQELAQRAMDTFREDIGRLFEGISRADEDLLTGALKTMHGVLKRMELDNA